MGDEKTQVLAFDREKRVYKDAYVANFRKVRHFPALATIGAGRSDGESIILVQEPAAAAATSTSGGCDTTTTTATNTRRARSTLDGVPGRLLPPDSLEAMFESTPPLSSFRSAVLCKHTKARLDLGLSPLSVMTTTTDRHRDADRFGVHAAEASTFKPPCSVDAKSAIQRKIVYDAQEYSDKSPAGRSFTPREGAALWSYNNPALAKEEIRTKKYFNVPPEGVIKADRRYTQEFIRKNVETYHASRSQRRRDED